MKNYTHPLLKMTANDLMSRVVEVIPRHMSLRTAARLLSQSRISGAPVVDDAGKCIGVISATDFVHCVEKEGDKPVRAPFPCVCAEWQVLDPECLPSGEVVVHMTPDPVMVSPATPIGSLARMMLDAHIHRVIVVDSDNRPIGVVSATDLLAAIAAADRNPAPEHPLHACCGSSCEPAHA